jgi:arginine decarboxylase
VRAVKQSATPLYSALLEYTKCKTVHFDVPGHKKRLPLGGPFDERFMRFDANSTHALDILSNPSGVIAEAEALIADAWGADCAFMMVNGSTSGVQAMILAACGPRDKILLPRNVHKSVVGGLILAGCAPVFIEPEINYEYGIANGPTYASVLKAVKENPDAKALLVINPTYFGAVADLRSIIKLCRRKRVAVIADEAHGAHFPFHPDLPDSAITQGADMATASMHKTAGSLTQSSVLLLNERNFSRHAVRAAINLTQTTSGSYLLMSSMDLARKRLATKGKEMYGGLLAALEAVKARIAAIPGLSVLTREDLNGAGMYDYDETKICVRVNGLGITGFEAYDMLLAEYGVQMELAETYVVLGIAGVGDDAGTLGRLVDALEDMSRRLYGQREPLSVMLADFFEKPKSVITPRDAWYAPKRVVPWGESVGEVSGESVMIYPPGIPLVIPGERITEATLEHYRFYLRQHCTVLTDEDEEGMVTILGE